MAGQQDDGTKTDDGPFMARQWARRAIQFDHRLGHAHLLSYGILAQRAAAAPIKDCCFWGLFDFF